MTVTMIGMATKPSSDRHKPSRMVRIPNAMAAALERIAEEQFNTLTEQVKTAVRLYLHGLGKLPPPPKAK